VPRSGSASRPAARGADTRRALVDAAAGVLREEGFAGATARAIAARAGCNQGLVFYHFGSVVNLLLAALDEVSAQRRARYEDALDRVVDFGGLVELAARVFAEDLDTGDAALLVEMIAGAASTPGLGAEVKARVAPWTRFAATALDGALARTPLGGAVAPGEIAHAVVALYLGLELLSHLDGDREPALALFARARQLAPLAGLVAGVWQTHGGPPAPSGGDDGAPGRRDASAPAGPPAGPEKGARR
jgi:AcrR family transcriptional regulator